MKSLWGDWLPDYVKALDAVAPSQEEKEILQKAAKIKATHKKRVKKVYLSFMEKV
jgi:hypothetical protein